MQICVLGPLEVRTSSGPALVPHRRTRAVLCSLASRPRRVVPPDVVVEDVWGDDAPSGATTTVRSYVARLRSALSAAAAADDGSPAAVVATRDGGYVLNVEDEQLDWLGFAQAVARADDLLTRRLVREAAGVLHTALDTWRGSPFTELAGTARTAELVSWLEELRVQALELRGEALLQLGRTDDLVPSLRALVVEQPLQERFWEQLVRALAMSGRRAEALLAFSRARDVLRTELQVEPGQRLCAALAAVLRGEPTSGDERERRSGTDRRSDRLRR